MFVTDRFGPDPPTIVFTLAVLLDNAGSLTDELTDAVSVITVPFATPLFTFTTSVNAPDPGAARLAFVHTTLPFAPIAGV